MEKLGPRDIFPFFYRYVVLVCLGWTALIALSFYVDYLAEENEIQDLALFAAKSSIAKDVVFRRWAASHGGVYVPITKQTPPSPYLSHLKNRDIVSTTGQRLTLVNPAYVMRQVYELEEKQIGERGHLTSMMPLRPENGPDEWEKIALQEFETGAKDFSSVNLVDGSQYLRLMLPLITEERCLKCHAGQGYALGDIRGGVSVAVPMAPYEGLAVKQMKAHLLGHSVILFVGLFGICSSALVIYRRARDRHKARNSLQKWSRIFGDAQWGVATRCINNDICELMNPAFAAMHGYSVEELSERALSDLVAPEKRLELLLFIAKAQESGHQSFESLAIRKDGTIFPTMWSLTVFREKIDNKECLAINVLDISERYQVEQEIHKLNEELEKRVRVRTAQLEDAQKVLKIEDERLRALLRLNQMNFDSVKKLREYALNEVVRICSSEIGYIHFVDQAQESLNLFVWLRGQIICSSEADNWQASLSEAGILGECVRQKKPLINNDCEGILLKNGLTDENISIRRCISAPVFDDGNIVAIVGVANKKEFYNDSDACQLSLFANNIWQMVKRKMTEDELSQAVVVSDNANRSKSEFLANMSHEIRTPMNAIMGLTHLALQTELSPQQQDYLEKAHDSCRSLLSIINDILDFSKMEAGRLTLECTEFYLEDILDTLSRSTELRAQEKDLEIIYTISPNVPSKLIGDPLRVCQVLINLLSNAIKFTEEGEIEVGIDLIKESEKSVILLFSVRDTGLGIAPKDLNKLFEAFRQADVSITRKHGGTGLGLTISKKLIGLMGGVIEVESELGCGSTFRFTVKFTPALKSRVIGQEMPGDLQGMRVLVVDDNPTARKILQVQLESFAFQVSLAESGEVALFLVEQAAERGVPFNLIFMDWKLTGMDGIEAALAIKQSKNLTLIPPIIMVTAYGREEVIQKIMKAELTACLFKPVGPSALFNKIMEVFGHKIIIERSRRMPKLVDMEGVKNIVGARILIAEDNRINRQIIRELIESWGLIAEIVEDGQEAVRLMAEQIQAVKNSGSSDPYYLFGHRFEAILMDIQMPKMDGFTATKEIREIEKNYLQDEPYFAGQSGSNALFYGGSGHTPIIAMTAHAMAGDRDKSLEIGMDDHIAKPIIPEELVACLLRWIAPRNKGGGGMRKGMDISKVVLDEGLALPENIPDLELKEGLKRVNGNRRLYRRLLRDFVCDNKGVVARIEGLLESGNLHKARIMVHTLKGVAGNIGAKTIYDAAKKLEAGIVHQKGSLSTLTMILNNHVQQLFEEFSSFESKQPVPRKLHQISPTQVVGRDLVRLRETIREMADFCRVNDIKAITVFAQISDKLQVVCPTQTKRLEKFFEKYDFTGALQEIESHFFNV